MQAAAAAGGAIAIAIAISLRASGHRLRSASSTADLRGGDASGLLLSTPNAAPASSGCAPGIETGAPECLYVNIDLVVTMDDSDTEFKDAFILTRGRAVVAVGCMTDLPDVDDSVPRVDLSGRVVIPGLINTHHHMFQSLTRCIAQDETLFGWLKTLYPTWLHLTSEHIYVSAKTIMAEMVLTGCTLTSDHLYLYPNDCRLDDEVRAAREIGMRFHPSRGAMSIGESKKGLPPDALVEEEPAILEDMKRVIREFHDPSPFSMIRVVLAPCSPFTVTKDLMKKAAGLAREHGVFLHTHLAEDDSDIEYSLKHFGQRPGEYIKEVGWVGSHVWHAHCCKLNQEELELFASTGTGLSHCPSSNCRLGSGIADVVQMLRTNVKVSLGVDGSASNDSGNVLNEARLAMLLQRVHPERRAAAMSAKEALRVATRGGAAVLGREECGWIGVGSAADFVAWRMDDMGFAGAQHDPMAALVFCIPHNMVDMSVINGRQVVRGGVLQTADANELIKRHNALSKQLFATAAAAKAAASC